MEFRNITISPRASSLSLLIVSLVIFYLLIRGLTWSSSSGIHTLMECLAMLLALATGCLALLYHRKKGRLQFLIIGAAFIGTGVLDGYHALVTSKYFINHLPSDLDSLIPWSWLASRVFLSAFFIISWLILKYEPKIDTRSKLNERVVFTIVALLTLQCFLFFAMVPLPQAYFEEAFFHRPEEFIPAALFLISAIIYYKRHYWRQDILEYWILIFLLINVILGSIYMPFSKQIFDLEFDIAHALKVIGYLCVLIGLVLKLFVPNYKKEKLELKLQFSIPSPSLIPKKLVKYLGIEIKISLFVSAMVIMSTIMIGFWTHYLFNTNLTKGELKQLIASANNASIRFDSAIIGMERDIHFLAGTPPIQGIIRAHNNHNIDPEDGSTKQEWRDRLSTIFSKMLSTAEDYIEIKYLSIQNNGHSIVNARKNLITNTVELVEYDSTYSFIEYDFYKNTVNKSLNYLFLSKIALYKINNSVVSPHTPVMVAAKPIYDEIGNYYGILVMVRNLNILFSDLNTMITDAHKLSIINQNGHYLLHQDKNKEFGFEFGTDSTIKHDWTETSKQVFSKGPSGTNIEKNTRGEQYAIGWQKYSYGPNDLRSHLGFITVTSYDEISAIPNQSRNATLVVVFITLPAVLLFGLALSKSITKPLRQMTRAVQSLTDNTPSEAFPVRANDEVGILAREFEKMIAQVHERTLTLEHEIRDRKHAERKIQKQAQQANLLYQATSIISDAVSLHDALQWCINSICEITGWPIGHGYKRSSPEDLEFISTGIWNKNFDNKFESFRIITKNTTFTYGIGLPGRIWESGKPAFIRNINNDQNFVRAKHHPLPLKSAFGFPIIVNGEVMVILEFFHTVQLYPDKDLLHTVEIIGNQIGLTLERKQSVDATARAEEKNRSILESAGQGIYGLDLQGNAIFINPSAAKMLGYDQTELIGKHIHTLVHHSYANGENYLEESCPMCAPMQDGTRHDALDEVLWRKNGSGFPVEYTSTPLHSGNEIYGSVITFSDITERKKSELALKESEIRHRAVLDSMVDGLITIDTNGSIESFNPAAVNIFGYQEKEVLGKNVKILMPEAYKAHHDHYLKRYLEANETHIIGEGREVEGLRKNGEVFPMEISINELNIDERRIFSGIVRDITERKKIEQIKNEFVSVISHELRTPLTSIQGSLALIAKGVTGKIPAQAKNLVDIALKNSKRLILLINDILDVEAIASGKIKYNTKKQPLLPIIMTSIETNKAYGKKFNVIFELIGRPIDVIVDVDADRLQQILTNLLSNAAKFSFNGGAVEIALSKQGSDILISVTDYGEGIPVEFHDNIFEKFSQADSSSTRKKGGTGLGLSITKSMVENMGGIIYFESKTGYGTTFHIKLPICKADIIHKGILNRAS